jgi:hypothetical protein
MSSSATAIFHRSARLAISTNEPQPVSVKLSVKADANNRKFWRLNLNCLLFPNQFATFFLSESMQQTVSIRG